MKTTTTLMIRAALFAAFFVPTTTAFAVRPFVTDDARIIDYGQLEVEHWLEFGRRPGDTMYAYNFMGGASFTDWFELIVGTGVGVDTEDGRRLSIINPVIQPKILFLKAEEDGRPGLAAATGVLLPYGKGSLNDRGWGGYGLLLATTRLFDDWLLLHLNLGATYTDDLGFGADWRPYWGFGFDLGLLREDFRLIGEVYSGDPLDLEKPRWSTQAGFRWLKSDYVNWDLTFGMQPHLEDHRRAGGHEYWAQIGLRLLFDVFTRDGKPGDWTGADGMFPR